MKITINNEGNKTRDDIVQEARNIWNEVRMARTALGLDGKKPKGAHKEPSTATEGALVNVLNNIALAHKQFYEAYPTVLKIMVFEGLFWWRIFSDYLTTVEKKPWKSDEDRLRSYATYSTLVWRKQNDNRHISLKEIKMAEDTFFQALDAEHKELQGRVEAAQSKFKEERNRLNEEKKKDMLAFLQKALTSENKEKVAEQIQEISDKAAEVKAQKQTIDARKEELKAALARYESQLKGTHN